MATQQTGLVSGNKQNTPGGATGRSRSRFPLSYSQFQTERFAEYAPFFVEEGVSGDKLPLHSNHEVQTYTLKSPILQSLAKKKDYFVVPMQAILPLNWEKFYSQPNIGQDVPSDCGLGVVNFWQKMKDLFDVSWSYLTSYITASPAPNAANTLQRVFRFLLFFENVYSCGSLMETLGTSGHNWFKCYYNPQGPGSSFITFDEFFDIWINLIQSSLSALETNHINVTIGAVTYGIYADPSTGNAPNSIGVREALELMRDDPTFTIASYSASTSAQSALVSAFAASSQDFTMSLPASDAPYNLGRLWAYQLCVFHFYSNDHVDYIYSADLFRQYIMELSARANTGATIEYVSSFFINGLTYQYDALSAHIFDVILANFSTTQGVFSYGGGSGSEGPSNINEALAYFTALFSFKRSLRFMDYFTGARTYPLAVGDHEVQVGTLTPGKLDIVELSRSSMMTKFLQAVNRSGRKFSAYMQELFGKTPAYDYHNPMYLAHTSDLVGAQETENTGAAQVDPNRAIAVTSRLRATSNRYAFEYYPDRDCIVIGITYYDLPRVYLRSTERQNFAIDRFDYFNPYLQFIGDQDISEAEIGTDTPDVTKPFAYQNKDMQFKQRYNQGCGGFAVPSTGLDNWIFPADMLRRNFLHNISPSFIRSFNSEIDRFYQSLTGYSLGTYWHFIVRYDNRQDASRPMAYNPVLSV